MYEQFLSCQLRFILSQRLWINNNLLSITHALKASVSVEKPKNKHTFAFTALTLLAQCQQQHLAYKTEW